MADLSPIDPTGTNDTADKPGQSDIMHHLGGISKAVDQIKMHHEELKKIYSGGDLPTKRSEVLSPLGGGMNYGTK